ncbi:FFLEELY motif protein [Rhodoferax sp.]|uniref:FFLEELY motif protein n=1 Tax=Rhodoferax sp. TaxID=50421 RepID=UPI00284B89C1|nr:hypothetical protein [Rhodoferax sp.]MDR3372083.1 hypothetical protein [Rhodoferax sp.]
MDASKRIRDAISRVSELRQIGSQDADLSRALSEVKGWQAKRFSNSYQDLLASPIYSGCANFFLEELYSARDYSQRDAQFAKVAVAIELTFPAQVMDIAVTLAELHQTTEELDLEMAKSWQGLGKKTPSVRYIESWLKVGQRGKREWQLDTVLKIGWELAALTRKRSLRLLLKMMRRPAELAGLGELQVFLETGFDLFSELARNSNAVNEFIDNIRKRESQWIDDLFNTNATHKAKNAQSCDWAFRA